MEKLRSLIKGEIGRDVISLETVDSTNAFAVRLGGKGAAHGTTVIAERQTKGRGRLGRRWESPAGGNIYMSVILRPLMDMRDVTLLTIMAGVACCGALRNSTGLAVEIKWPNDLMVSGRKLGGILTEIRSSAGRVIFAVLGMGINVNTCLEDYPPEVRAIATSVMNETSKEQSVTLLATGILNELDRWYGILMREGRGPVLNEWRRFSSMLGGVVEVIVGEEAFRGVAEDIDDEGRLLLRLSSGELKNISAGDLKILR